MLRQSFAANRHVPGEFQFFYETRDGKGGIAGPFMRISVSSAAVGSGESLRPHIKPPGEGWPKPDSRQIFTSVIPGQVRLPRRCPGKSTTEICAPSQTYFLGPKNIPGTRAVDAIWLK
jgi:hypothetical protein